MEAYVAPKTILNRHGLMLIVNENKKAEFSSTESVRLLNRLYCASKKDNKKTQLRFALVKHLDVITYLHIF